MAQDKKVLFEALDDKAKAALRRKSIRDLEVEQTRAREAVREISQACPEADGIHDFEAGAKELKTTATELKERYANASAHFTECQSLNVEKTRSEGMRVIANANVVGEQEYREQGYASYPGENIFSRLERLHGAEELSEGVLNLAAGEQRDIAIPTATFHDINNAVMKRSGGSETPPTGIVTSKPVNVESPYEAVDKRRVLVDILPTIVGSGDTFKFRKEIDAGVANAVAPALEGTASALQSFGAKEESVTIETLRAYGTITEEQAADVQVARPYASMLLSRGMKDVVETQLVGGNGTSPNIRGLQNVSGRLTNDKNAAQVNPDPDFGPMKILDYILYMMEKYEADRSSGAGTSATHCLMRPATHRLFQREKTTDNWYLYGMPADKSFMTLWGVPVIYTDFAAANEMFYINADPRYILFITRQGVNIQTGWNGDDFKNNQRSLRITSRCALAVPRPRTIQQLTNVNTTT